MSEINASTKLATLAFLEKVLQPIVDRLKSSESFAEGIVGIPDGGSKGFVQTKNSDADGDASWVSLESAETALEESLKEYINEQIKEVEPDIIDDGEI